MESKQYPTWVMERYFGGTHVADVPGDHRGESVWPEGDVAPAAAECCDVLVESTRDLSDASNCTFVFLVGGAGNGKSFLARRVAQNLQGKRTGHESVYASRSYDYLVDESKQMRIINDATIPPRDETNRKDYLIRDISEALDRRSNLLACVNRGVLVSEVNSAEVDPEKPHYSLAKRIVKWLLNGECFKDNQLPDGYKGSFSPSNKSGFYAYCLLTNSQGVKIRVHVAFMDQASLFEPSLDRCERSKDEVFGPLSVDTLKVLPIRSEQRVAASINAIDLIGRYVNRLYEDCLSIGFPGGELDPVRANLITLKSSTALMGMCSVLRGAEIVSGSHVTYRDLWGVSVLGTIGAAPSNQLNRHAQEVSKLTEQFSNGDIEEKLLAMVRLAGIRINSTFFGHQPPKFIEPEWMSSFPSVQVLRALKQVDPLISLDARASKVLREKLSLLDERQGPGQRLAMEDDSFRLVWTEFDVALENAILEWLYRRDAPKTSERNELLSWYGHYLSRLYCLVKGLPAHNDLINLWQEVWKKASLNGRLPDEVTSGLTRLVFEPFDERNANSYFPVFSSHVEPIIASDNATELALQINASDYVWSSEVQGDAVTVILKKYSISDASIQILLDFQLLREAMIKVSGGGFTETAIDVEPRVERLRAEILALEASSRLHDFGEMPEYAFVIGGTTLS